VNGQYAAIETVSPRFVDAIRSSVKGPTHDKSDYYYIPRFYLLHKS
jgi:hypothetical protein